MAKATRTNTRKPKDQKPADLATVEQLAKIEFEAYPQMKTLEERISKVEWDKLGFGTRLAYVNCRKTKEELIEVVREMGGEEAENALDIFETVEERGQGIAELANTAKMRLLVAMAALGMQQEAANEHQAK